MKATELQIGDWVFIKDYPIKGLPQKVKPEHFVRSLVEFEPIPLTTEILEKNGFYYDDGRKAYLMGVIFRVKPERDGLFSFEICGCPYPLNTVHQLQHALRLCGITREIII